MKPSWCNSELSAQSSRLEVWVQAPLGVCGQGCASSQHPASSPQAEGIVEGELFILLSPSSWLEDVHSHLWGLSALRQLLIPILASPPNTRIDLFRVYVNKHLDPPWLSKYDIIQSSLLERKENTDTEVEFSPCNVVCFYLGVNSVF